MTQTRRNLITGGLAVAGASLSGMPLPALAQKYKEQQSFTQNEWPVDKPPRRFPGCRDKS